MKRILLIIICFAFIKTTYSQNDIAFCKAVETGDFNKVERIFKREIKKRKNGKVYNNGPGMGMQITHIYNLDTLTMWLKSKTCIKDAFWDKCQNKISIYPGSAIIGVLFKTKNSFQEKCFLIQIGTTGTLKIYNWRIPFSKMKNKLIFKKMYDCAGFITEHNKNCNVSK